MGGGRVVSEDRAEQKFHFNPILTQKNAYDDSSRKDG